MIKLNIIGVGEVDNKNFVDHDDEATCCDE